MNKISEEKKKKIHLEYTRKVVAVYTMVCRNQCMFDTRIDQQSQYGVC